jgi:hypothetical protein
MTDHLADQTVPLSVRSAVADAALALAEAMIEGNERTVHLAYQVMLVSVEDFRICKKAADLGMV